METTGEPAVGRKDEFNYLQSALKTPGFILSGSQRTQHYNSLHDICIVPSVISNVE